MTKPEIKTIDVHELKSKMESESDCCLIDVRELEEWHDIRIPGALHIPKDQISVIIQTKVVDPDKPVYLHCRSGVRSLYAAQCMIDLGYQQVYSVNGGIMEWAMYGYPIEQ